MVALEKKDDYEYLNIQQLCDVGRMSREGPLGMEQPCLAVCICFGLRSQSLIPPEPAKPPNYSLFLVQRWFRISLCYGYEVSYRHLVERDDLGLEDDLPAEIQTEPEWDCKVV